MDQPLAPVDLFDFDLDVEVKPEPKPEAVPTPAVGVVTGRAPGVVPAGQQRSFTRFGAGAASEMPSPPVMPTGNIKPAYGLVGVPDEAVTTRDVKVFAFGAAAGALIAFVFSWAGRRSAGL